MDLKGKVALVTGAASGMGRLTVLRLAQRGATVAALDVNKEGLAETQALSQNISPFVCDIGDYNSVKQTVNTVREQLGSIDRLVHCAAVMPMSLISKTPIEKTLLIMKINFEGTVYILDAVLPEMVNRNEGEIIVFGSVAGDIQMPYGGAYCASKSALNAFVKQLIMENKTNAVKIMLVCPPAVNTPLLSQAQTGMHYDFDKQKRQKLVVEPDVVLDKVDRAFARNKKIVYPTWVAKFVLWFSRLMPLTFMNQTFKSATQDILPGNDTVVAALGSKNR